MNKRYIFRLEETERGQLLELVKTGEALIATASSSGPSEGCARWALNLRAERVV